MREVLVIVKMVERKSERAPKSKRDKSMMVRKGTEVMNGVDRYEMTR